MPCAYTQFNIVSHHGCVNEHHLTDVQRARCWRDPQFMYFADGTFSPSVHRLVFDRYEFTVANNGYATLYEVTIADPLLVSGASAHSYRPGVSHAGLVIKRKICARSPILSRELR